MRIHHIALRTLDTPRLERFYAELLGLRVTRRSERSVWLDAGGAVVMLERADPGEPAIPKGTRELVAFAVTAAEREALGARLAQAGVPSDGQTEHTIYLRDPDGRRVGLSSYPL